MYDRLNVGDQLIVAHTPRGANPAGIAKGDRARVSEVRTDSHQRKYSFRFDGYGNAGRCSRKPVQLHRRMFSRYGVVTAPSTRVESQPPPALDRRCDALSSQLGKLLDRLDAVVAALKSTTPAGA